jgi:sensor histidine kinase regulating citrate/malate metabolism
MSSQAAKRSKTTLPTVPQVKTEEFLEEKSVTQETTVINEIPVPITTDTSMIAILAKRKAEKLEQQPQLLNLKFLFSQLRNSMC